MVRQVDGETGPESHMAEFFVLRAYRRRGVGSEAARRLFARFPGQWRLDVLPNNARAQTFWRRMIAEVSSGTPTKGVDERGKTWYAFVVGHND